MAYDLFQPTPGQALSEEDVWRWYNNIVLELNLSFLDQTEKDYLTFYYYSAGLLKNWRRPFFRRHYACTFSSAANFLLHDQSSPIILDLGGGAGTQGLLLALMGARVFILDMDSMALQVLKKRIEFYQAQFGIQLNITSACINSLNFNYKSISPINGLYSMFAFNMMQPFESLLALICPQMATGSRFVVQDGNRSSWSSKIFPSRRRNVLSPKEFESELDIWGFRTVSHRGGVVFPPILWALFSTPILVRWDEVLGQNWLMPISHQIMAIKQ